jgi:hypothetical protein
LELVEEEWAKQPYHAAEQLETKSATSSEARHQCSSFARQASYSYAVKGAEKYGHRVVGCAVLMGGSMPDGPSNRFSLSISECTKLGAHFAKHPLPLPDTNLKVVEVPIRRSTSLLFSHWVPPRANSGQRSPVLVTDRRAMGQDQKEATVAAMIALK